ncbi:MAG: polysaccharide biosynthesis C-terminal domain-containing protein [Polaribacter sp.]|nr:polysaccharide biosynthesis C-terminal domain-containing protein [Polaribacter sp.]MDG1811339.1 polysaccharide biosynthesis C-terminal domain-containing protein [Polaribacter sp.]MDG1993740.1 polysaccharide biosynthesis C-terminal domain-containing protein [Polaribacter sp.]
MSLLKSYIQNFISRAGGQILSASVIGRFFSFVASWVALQLIPNSELGIVLFAYSIVVFITPISGFGLHQGLLRYGSLLKTTQEKNSLFRYALIKGIWTTILLIFIIGIISFYIDFQFKNTRYYLIFLSLSLVPIYIFELIKIHFRLHHKNKLFAHTEIIFNILLVLLVLILSYFFKENGYAIALVLTPIISIFFLASKFVVDLKDKEKLSTITFEFWKYGIFASLSNVATQLLFVIDILLIGLLLNDSEMVTNYKYISLIPLSLLFLPRAFINTDFVAFTERIFDKNHIVKYIKSYVLLFTILSVFFCVFFIFFADFILNLFDKSFTQYKKSFIILIVGVSGVLILRGLFGNLLSSIGKAHVNFYITSAALLINILSNYYLIPKYGLNGAAITSASLMWLTGIVSTIVFWRLYNKGLRSRK